jgi:serine/threonine protein phosphatase PrpC
MSTRLTVAAQSDIGRVRPTNEDAFVVADLLGGAPRFDAGVARFDIGARGALLAVSDGMGGHKAGEVASAMTLASLHRSLVERMSSPDPGARLTRATKTANADVYEAGRRPSLNNMGATLTAVLVDGPVAHIAQVGDSRAYVIRNGEILRLTRDQSLAEQVVRAGGLDPAEVAESPLRNLLLQAVGQTLELTVAVSILDLRSRDCLLLCSDGLTSKLTDVEIRDIIIGAPSLGAACAALIELANARGSEDNVTAVLAGITGELPAAVPTRAFEGTYRVLREFEPSSLPFGMSSGR